MHYTFSNTVAHPGQRRIDQTCGETIAQAERVLIVDDELPIRILLTRILKGWGYGVRHVGSAVEALNMMAAEPADVLMCDVTMPEYDGLWLAKQVHTQWPRTLIIMVTGHNDAYTVQTSRRLGAVAYLTKPFSQYMLREVLNRGPAIGPSVSRAINSSLDGLARGSLVFGSAKGPRATDDRSAPSRIW